MRAWGGTMNTEMIKNEVILPKLNDCGGDISKQWFVYFSVFNPARGKMKVIRKYEGFGKLITEAERRSYAKKAIRKWKNKLLSGWNPIFEQDKIKYASLIKYDYDARHKGAIVESSRNYEYYTSKYLDYIVNVRGVRPSTYTSYKSKLRIFGLYLKEKNINQVSIRFYDDRTISSFNAWLMKPHMVGKKKVEALENRTLNEYNEIIKRFFKYTIEIEKVMRDNPVDRCIRYKEAGTHHRAYNKTYIELFREKISTTDEWLWLMIKVLFSCLIHPGELRHLKIENFDWKDGAIFIPKNISKNQKDGIVTIPNHLLKELIDNNYHTCPNEYYFMSKTKGPGPDRVGRNFLYRNMKHFLIELGIPKGYTLYSWKHTGVQRLAISGASLISIKNQLRHSSLDEMLPYIEELMAQDNDAIRQNAPAL